MGKYTVLRIERQVLVAACWTDDLCLTWGEAAGTAHIQAVFDYSSAEVRMILRRGPNEQVLAEDLQNGYARSLVVTMMCGDDVVLQWRTAPSEAMARSEVAELSLREYTA